MVYENNNKISSLFKLKRLFINNPILQPASDFPIDSYKSIVDKFEGVNKDKILVFMPDDYLKESIFSILINTGIYKQVEYMNSYRLVDIYLGKDEEHQSLVTLPHSPLCLYIGYNEMENKRQHDFILQLMDLYSIQRKSLWIIVKGKETTYSAIKELAEKLKYSIVSLQKTSNYEMERTIL